MVLIVCEFGWLLCNLLLFIKVDVLCALFFCILVVSSWFLFIYVCRSCLCFWVWSIGE